MHWLGTNVKALIFDLDGLLVDSEPTWFRVEGAFLAQLGHTWTEADAAACMGQGTPNTLRVWRERFGVAVDIDRDTETIMDRVIAAAPKMPLKSGAMALLAAAAKASVPMAVASSSRSRLVNAILRAKGIHSYFSVVVGGDRAAHPKPAPDIFLAAASSLAIAPQECLVFEDTLAGVRAAKAAGCSVIAIPTANPVEISAIADLVLPGLADAVSELGLG